MIIITYNRLGLTISHLGS